MKTILAVLSLLCFLAPPLSAQIDKGAFGLDRLLAPQPHYLPEYTFDSSMDATRWQQVGHGLQVSFASTDRHYFRTEVPEVPASLVWRATGWKGERLNTMILVWSPDTLQQVRFL